MGDIQLIIVFVVVGAAIAYALWRVYKAWQLANDPCAGCTDCPLRNAKCKKVNKKFGSNK